LFDSLDISQYLGGIIYVKIYINRFKIRLVGKNLEKDLTASKPFSHERMLIGSFYEAESLLKEGIKKIYGRKVLSPIVIMHPFERMEGGLTTVEEMALRDLGAAVGAREVFIVIGAERSDKELIRELKTASKGAMKRIST